MKAKKYLVLSPDGFPIEMDCNYSSLLEAQTALDNFVKRFEGQGYYSTSNRERLSLNDIKGYCEIVEV